jgi:hypothetical protein
MFPVAAYHALLVLPRIAGSVRPAPAWSGSSTVDVLSTATDEPAAPRRLERPMVTVDEPSGVRDRSGFFPATDLSPFVQPRAAIYRAGAATILVAGEGRAER